MDVLQETAGPPEAAATTAALASLDRTGADRRAILLYSSVLIVALNFTSPSVGLFVIPISFVLKNRLHLSANELAIFTLWAGIAAYFAFAFGIVRDRWSPLGRGDRGYFILFGAASALFYLAFCFFRVSEAMLLANAVIEVVCYLFLWAAWNGLASTIGQRHAMSGQMSAVWNFAGTLATFAALTLGGVLSDQLEGLSAESSVRVLFLLAAATFATIAALGLWKPAAVFSEVGRDASDRRDLFADLSRLLKHWPIYPAVGIWLLWNFSPGTQTVLQYYMADKLHASDAQWGAYNAIFSVASVPMFALFGVLSRRFSLGALLWWGGLLGVGQVVPLLLVHTANGIVVASVFVGLLGGIATAAYMDLLIRSCPVGLEGAMMMLAWTMYALATNFGNLWGTDLYEHHGGFVICMIATTIVYALILPLILLVPKRLITSADSA
jgi:predicted MFS family arabinose efflux permease